jgi:hypothetical protein
VAQKKKMSKSAFLSRAPASIAGNEKSDPGMLSRLFNEISDPARVRALKKAIDSLEKHGFSGTTVTSPRWNPGHKVDVRLGRVAGEQFMARTETAILIGQTHDLPEPQPKRGRGFVLVPTSWGRDPNEAIRAHAGKPMTGCSAKRANSSRPP